MKRPYDTLAEQSVKSMNWAVRTDCVSRSVLRHDRHLPDLFCRMLKQSLFSPAQPRRTKTRHFPCIVFASLRGSTRVVRKSEALEGLFRSPRSMTKANGPTKCGPYLLASSPLRSLRPCTRNGAFLGSKSVLAGSGREGERAAEVGRVRRQACLSILRQLCHWNHPYG